MRHGFGLWLSRGVFRSPPLAFGLIRPGIHLRPTKGRSYFFRSRDTAELAEVLGSWWGRPVSQPLPKERPKKARKARSEPAKGQAAAGAAAPGAPTPRTAAGITTLGAASRAATRRSTPPPPPGPTDPEEDIGLRQHRTHGRGDAGVARGRIALDHSPGTAAGVDRAGLRGQGYPISASVACLRQPISASAAITSSLLGRMR